ncbi:MAG: hypothetical protein AAF654_00815 [Myxococcota bacterium]
MRDTDLFCWGANESGQLARAPSSDVFESPQPVLAGVRSASVGGEDFGGTVTTHVCAVLESGEVACWGEGRRGRLGLGDTLSRSDPEVLDPFSSSPAVQVEAGGGSTCARMQNGEAYCWGNNVFGQLGASVADEFLTRPVRVEAPDGGSWRDLSSGLLHVCGIASGHVYCWGQNANGQLGVSTDVGQSGRPVAIELNVSVEFQDVACGGFHCCALDRDGNAYCWGGNQFGNTGREPNASNLDNVDRVVGSFRFVSLQCGRSHCCGIGLHGALTCWGRNREGQLGVAEDTLDRFRPTPVIGPAVGWTEAGLGNTSSCGVIDGQFLWCWGDNAFGQLADAAGQGRLTPERSCLPN